MAEKTQTPSTTETTKPTGVEPWDEVGVVNPQSPALKSLLPFDAEAGREALTPPTPEKPAKPSP